MNTATKVDHSDQNHIDTNNAWAIVHSLNQAKCGCEIFKAMNTLHTDNLHELFHMIEHILAEREDTINN